MPPYLVGLCNILYNGRGVFSQFAVNSGLRRVCVSLKCLQESRALRDYKGTSTSTILLILACRYCLTMGIAITVFRYWFSDAALS